MASQKFLFLVTLLLVSLACAKASLIKCESADDCYKHIDCINQPVHCTNGICSCHASEQSESVKLSSPPRKACRTTQDCRKNICEFGTAFCISGFCSCT
ncbi:hypothetical protein ABFS82_12G086000 [Erythranthe guttata]